MTPRRICLDARFYRASTAGVGRYTRGLIHALQKIDRVNHYTVILTPADYAEWPKTAMPANWRVKILNIVHYSLGEQTRLLKYLNDEKFDLVHFTMFNHPIAYRRPYVVTIHDLIMHYYPPRALWHPRTWLYRFVMWQAAHGARAIIAPSQSSRRDVAKMLHVAADKIVVTPEAVEPEFRPVADARRFAKIKKNLGLTKPFLFYMNAWRAHKGIPEMIDAFLAIKSTHDVQLLIAGKPNPAFPAIVAAVQRGQGRSKDILTPGFISDEDAIALYSMAAAFVVPTHYEGFGLPPLEAMACGCPVVSARNSSLPEVLGDAAIFFRTGDVADLSRALDLVLSDPQIQRRLRRLGLAQAQRFSFAQMAQETLSVYSSLLA